MDPTLYVQPDDLKRTLELDGTSFADADIERACKAASRALELPLTGRLRYYNPDASNDEVRYYTPPGPLTVHVDDLVGVTSIKGDRDGDGVYEITFQAGVDYVLEPLNAALDGKPWERIKLRNWRAWLMPALVPAGVEVTGRFGWLQTPTEIEQAAVILATKLLKRSREAPFSVLGIGLDNVAVRIGSYDAEIQMLIHELDRRPWVG